MGRLDSFREVQITVISGEGQGCIYTGYHSSGDRCRCFDAARIFYKSCFLLFLFFSFFFPLCTKK